MNRLIIFLFAAMAAFPFLWNHFKTTPTKKNIPVASIKKKNDTKTVELVRLKSFVTSLKSYAISNDYNTNYCFLVDMKINSGSNRFFVYDIKKDSLLRSGLVAHGYGNSSYSNISFSNVPGSNCTSLGKYKIGNAYNGRFGLAYKLHGLDKTNSNAFNRFVVLHSHECVPAAEVEPEAICMSQGCPTVSPVFLQSLRTYLDDADKPVLLWIFK